MYGAIEMKIYLVLSHLGSSLLLSTVVQYNLSQDSFKLAI